MIVKYRHLLEKGGAIPLFLLLFIVFGGCGRVHSAFSHKKVVHEVCFYPSALPTSATTDDVKRAANLFAKNARKAGISVYDSFVLNNNACFFLSTGRPFSVPFSQPKTISPQVRYILSSTFSNSTFSRYSVRGNTLLTIKDTYSLDAKLSPLPAIIDGIRIVDKPSKIIRFFRLTRRLHIPVNIGITASGAVALQTKGFQQGSTTVLLWEKLTPKLSRPVPGEYAVTGSAPSVRKETVIPFKPDWNMRSVSSGTTENVKEINILFSTGTANIPWSEEFLLRFLYTLAQSQQSSEPLEVLFAPQLSGGTPTVKATLLSSELRFPDIQTVIPWKVQLWLQSLHQETHNYPLAFYANLLALKMAKKVFTGNPAFLGGKNLIGPATTLPINEMKKYLFRKDGVLVEAAHPASLYLYDGDVLFESTLLNEKPASPFKTYFGSRDGAISVIITFLAAGKASDQLIDTIAQQLPYSVILRLQEAISDGLNWSSLSISVPLNQEKKVVSLYSSFASPTAATKLYLGVYRVKKTNRN